jgi:hypothetical protein
LAYETKPRKLDTPFIGKVIARKILRGLPFARPLYNVIGYAPKRHYLLVREFGKEQEISVPRDRYEIASEEEVADWVANRVRGEEPKNHIVNDAFVQQPHRRDWQWSSK